jgi:hypothetical protein
MKIIQIILVISLIIISVEQNINSLIEGYKNSSGNNVNLNQSNGIIPSNSNNGIINNDFNFQNNLPSIPINVNVSTNDGIIVQNGKLLNQIININDSNSDITFKISGDYLSLDYSKIVYDSNLIDISYKEKSEINNDNSINNINQLSMGLSGSGLNDLNSSNLNLNINSNSKVDTNLSTNANSISNNNLISNSNFMQNSYVNGKPEKIITFYFKCYSNAATDISIIFNFNAIHNLDLKINKICYYGFFDKIEYYFFLFVKIVFLLIMIAFLTFLYSIYKVGISNNSSSNCNEGVTIKQFFYNIYDWFYKDNKYEENGINNKMNYDSKYKMLTSENQMVNPKFYENPTLIVSKRIKFNYENYGGC